MRRRKKMRRRKRKKNNLELQPLCTEAWHYWTDRGIRSTSYETLDYAVGIGCVTADDQERAQVVYMLVNKLTGVVEYSTSVLPEALANMVAIQAGLDNERAKLGPVTSKTKN